MHVHSRLINGFAKAYRTGFDVLDGIRQKRFQIPNLELDLREKKSTRNPCTL